MRLTHCMPRHRVHTTLPARLDGAPSFGLHADIDRLFGNLLSAIDAPVGNTGTVTLRPRVDLAETDAEYRVEAELAGTPRRSWHRRCRRR